MALTGKIDFRKTWSGSLLLLVEEDVKALFSRKLKRRWRRATLMDLAQPELRLLIDMRSQPQLSWRTSLALVPQAPRSPLPGLALGGDNSGEEGHRRVTH